MAPRRLAPGKYFFWPFKAVRDLLCWVGFHDTTYDAEMGEYHPDIPCLWCEFDPWGDNDA